MLDINLTEYKDADVARVRFYPNGTCDELTHRSCTRTRASGTRSPCEITTSAWTRPIGRHSET